MYVYHVTQPIHNISDSFQQEIITLSSTYSLNTSLVRDLPLGWPAYAASFPGGPLYLTWRHQQRAYNRYFAIY